MGCGGVGWGGVGVLETHWIMLVVALLWVFGDRETGNWVFKELVCSLHHRQVSSQTTSETPAPLLPPPPGSASIGAMFPRLLDAVPSRHGIPVLGGLHCRMGNVLEGMGILGLAALPVPPWGHGWGRVAQ